MSLSTLSFDTNLINLLMRLDLTLAHLIFALMLSV